MLNLQGLWVGVRGREGPAAGERGRCGCHAQSRQGGHLRLEAGRVPSRHPVRGLGWACEGLTGLELDLVGSGQQTRADVLGQSMLYQKCQDRRHLATL